jgi:rfaE bifunctional protein kinase chain/domain
MVKVLVIGDVMLDKYIIGNVNRMSPEAPVPVVNVSKEEFRLGGAANVAHNLVSLGIETYIMGAIGDDINGMVMTEILKKKNIGSANIVFNSGFPTTTKTRIVGNHQQIVRFDNEIQLNDNNLLIDSFNHVYDKTELKTIVISDYNKGVCSSKFCTTIIKYASNKNINVIVDPKGTDWEKYSFSYCVTPNLKELSEAIGTPIKNEDEEVAFWGKKVLTKYNFENLLVTRSEKGMTLINKDFVHHLPSVAREVYDVSGAGDTVIAAFSAAYAEGKSIIESAKIANFAAGYVVSKFGTYAINKEELDNIISNNL